MVININDVVVAAIIYSVFVCLFSSIAGSQAIIVFGVAHNNNNMCVFRWILCNGLMLVAPCARALSQSPLNRNAQPNAHLHIYTRALTHTEALAVIFLLILPQN